MDDFEEFISGSATEEYVIQAHKSDTDKIGIDFKKELNKEQYSAVSSPPGAAMVLAGAGSGKTRTLTYRTAFLLEQGVKPWQILLLTFTNKAAKEMMNRVVELAQADFGKFWGGTFHSIFCRILRQHAAAIGFERNFSILDREDQKDLLTRTLADANFEIDKKRFPRADVLAEILSMTTNAMIECEEMIAARYPQFEDVTLEIATARKIYIQKKKQSNSMDFDDLLAKTMELFQKEPEILRRYQERFRHILVDEYQDTNKLQAKLVDMLAVGHGNVMVVGDDAQSIYSWRGADYHNILEFPKRYPDARVYRIELNYRSAPGILKLANAAILANAKQFRKNLRAVRKNLQVKPRYVSVDSPDEQARFIAQRILELQEEGMEFNEMAVLYRAHYQCLEIQLELTRRNIPFRITSGLRFFEQAHVKDVLAYIRLVTNLEDEVAFRRVVCMMPGIGVKTAEKLRQNFLREFSEFIGDKRQRKPINFSKKLLSFKVPKKAQKAWQDFALSLDELAAKNDEFPPPSEMLLSIIDGVYQELLKVKFANFESRREDLLQLAHFAKQFSSVEDFLSQVSLLSSSDDEAGSAGKQSEKDAVNLSTIHQAKGLEWEAVFLIWLNEGAFPSKRAIVSKREEDLEEERRLFYVAVTRAKDDLYLLRPEFWPQAWNGEFHQRPSRFLRDFPEDLVKTWRVRSRSRSKSY